MAPLIGGIVAAIVGIVFLVLWFGSFVSLLKGGIPLALVLGGALAIYIGYDELKDKLRKSEET